MLVAVAVAVGIAVIAAAPQLAVSASFTQLSTSLSFSDISYYPAKRPPNAPCPMPHAACPTNIATPSPTEH